jgi:pilus assembly protein Flp/PilA
MRYSRPPDRLLSNPALTNQSSGLMWKSRSYPMTKFVRFIKDESGATAIEYGLIAAATGLALVAALPAIETGLGVVFGDIGTALN